MKAVAVYELLMLAGPDAPTPPQVLVLSNPLPTSTLILSGLVPEVLSDEISVYSFCCFLTSDRTGACVRGFSRVVPVTWTNLCCVL
jgi:hypothetical protein